MRAALTAALTAAPPRLLLLVAALLALVLATYAAAPDNGFHFDDRDNIVEHRPLQLERLSLAGLWQAGRQAFLPTRPLASVSFAIDWWRGGGDPRPFQWTNLLLHALTTLASFALLRQALAAAGRRGAWADLVAALAAGLWAAHPIQVQAVTYIVQRMALLAALFSLLSVYCFLRGRLAPRAGAAWFAAALGCFALGALSKENAWITPALWWLADYGLRRRETRLLGGSADRLLFALPFVLLLLVVADIASGAGPLAQRLLPGYEHRPFTLAERLLTQPRVLVFHLSQIAWPAPHRFSLEHDFALSRALFDPPGTAGALAAVLGWCAVGVAALWRKPTRVTGFFLLWLPATLVIESSAASLEMVFEHRLYLPSLGLAGLAAIAVAGLRRRATRGAAAVLALALMGALAWSAQQRVAVWRSDLSLYGDARVHAPGSARVWSVYGEALLEAGRREEAERALGRAIELDPDAAGALEKMGLILFDRGDFTGADRLLRRALELRGARHSLLNHLGEIYMQTQSYEVARDMFARAAEAAPGEPAYRWNLALALERLGECGAARDAWQAFLSIGASDEELAQVQAHLADVHGEHGACATDR